MPNKVLPFKRRPNLTLVMIVKDAERFIDRALKSVAGMVDEIVVVDTGSTDETKKIAARYKARIVDFEWVDDFSAARNAGIDAATGDWIFMLDSDEELTSAPTDLGPLLCDERHQAYLVHRVTGSSPSATDVSDSVAQIRLFRRLPELRYRNRIHEQLTIEDAEKIGWSEIELLHFGPSMTGSGDRSARNVPLLERALEEDPENGYFWFCLGDEYFLKDPAAAYEAYYQAMTRSDPNELWAPPMLRNMAWCMYMLGHKDNAVALLRDLQMNYSKYTDVFFVEGNIALNEGDHQRAAYIFKRCLEMGDPPAVFGSWGGTGSWRAASALRDAQAKQRQS